MKKTYTYEELLALKQNKPDEFLAHARTFVQLEKRFQKSQEDFNDSHKENGKVICVLREDWITAREAKTGGVMANKTFPEYYKSVMGVPPTNRGHSCANAFAAFVRSGKITEDDYDLNSSEAIERASRVVSKVKDKLDHPAIAEAAKLLKQRPSKLLQMLKDLLGRIIEQPVANGNDLVQDGEDIPTEVVLITAEQAAERAGRISITDAHVQIDGLLKAGHLGAVLAALSTLAKTTATEAEARDLTQWLARSPALFEENKDEKGARRFAPEKLNEWAAEVLPPVDFEQRWNTLRDELLNLEECAGVEIVDEWEKKRTPSPSFTKSPQAATA